MRHILRSALRSHLLAVGVVVERWISRTVIGTLAMGGVMMIIGAATKAPTTVTIGLCISAAGCFIQGVGRLLER